jgi:predicted nucleotidyltransferase component of viral defense system
MANESFEVLVERAMQAGGRAHMRPVIEKELLHHDILFALDQASLLEHLTFQGGTALRLCYGAQRFSEDLDFVVERDLPDASFRQIGSSIVNHLEKRYGLEVRLKEMVKVNIARVPAYTREPRSLQSHYDFLPDGYRDLIVLVESLDEILADKLVSLPANTAYVRHRDIWDMHWLRQQGARPDAAMVASKIRDYGVEDYGALTTRLIERLPGIIHGKEFRDQMSRFIPRDVQERTLLKERFLELLERETAEVLREVSVPSRG